MSKIFLYIDESKDYSNGILHIGGYFSHLSFQKMEKYCQSFIPKGNSTELKSTKPFDRNFFEEILLKDDLHFTTINLTLNTKGDKEYLLSIIHLLDYLFSILGSDCSDIDIYCDNIKLDSDMKKLEKTFSKKLQNVFKKNINLEFRPSIYRCIQFADLSVGRHRRKQ